MQTLYSPLQYRNITPDIAKYKIKAFVTEMNEVREALNDVGEVAVNVDGISEGRTGRQAKKMSCRICNN